jgi:hypothetical protein
MTYEPPFDLYNVDPDDTGRLVEHSPEGFGYYAVGDDGNDEELVGFWCFGPEARAAEAKQGVGR